LREDVNLSREDKMTRRNATWMALVAITVPLVAWQKPNFTGTWRMDPSRSRFGTDRTPKSLVWEIQHRDPILKLTEIEPSDRRSEEVTTDGTPQKSNIMLSEIWMETRARWKAETLEWIRTSNLPKEVVVDAWTLSKDGKTLTVERPARGVHIIFSKTP
jgi:hypothetical protein